MSNNDVTDFEVCGFTKNTNIKNTWKQNINGYDMAKNSFLLEVTLCIALVAYWYLVPSVC